MTWLILSNGAEQHLSGPYAAQAQKCDANLPYPLKVIGG